MPIEIRIRKINAQRFQLTLVYAGIGNTATTFTSDWKQYVADHGFQRIPRIWDAA